MQSPDLRAMVRDHLIRDALAYLPHAGTEIYNLMVAKTGANPGRGTKITGETLPADQPAVGGGHCHAD